MTKEGVKVKKKGCSNCAHWVNKENGCDLVYDKDMLEEGCNETNDFKFWNGEKRCCWTCIDDDFGRCLREPVEYCCEENNFPFWRSDKEHQERRMKELEPQEVTCADDEKDTPTELSESKPDCDNICNLCYKKDCSFREIHKGYSDSSESKEEKRLFDVEHVPFGLYKVWWKSGGSSLASIGGMYNGDRWIAPTNWTSEDNPTGLLKNHIEDIIRMDMIDSELNLKSFEKGYRFKMEADELRNTVKPQEEKGIEVKFRIPENYRMGDNLIPTDEFRRGLIKIYKKEELEAELKLRKPQGEKEDYPECFGHFDDKGRICDSDCFALRECSQSGDAGCIKPQGKTCIKSHYGDVDITPELEHREATCQWKYHKLYTAQGDYYCGVYEVEEYYVSCLDKKLQILSLGKYCPYCGRKIEVVE